MKKVFALLLALLLCLPLLACESREERELREAIEAAERAEDAYLDALEDYNDTMAAIDEYNRLQDLLD